MKPGERREVCRMLKDVGEMTTINVRTQKKPTTVEKKRTVPFLLGSADTGFHHIGVKVVEQIGLVALKQGGNKE